MVEYYLHATNFYYVAIITGGCQWQSAQLITKKIGDRIHLHCLENSPCHGTTYLFYHKGLDSAKPAEMVHNGSYRFVTTIDTMSSAGEYYCIKECAARNVTTNNDFKCYWNVISKLHNS